MAEAPDTYETFVSQILRPTILSNLKEPVRYEKVSVLIYRRGEIEQELEYEHIFPFYTVADLSTQIYISMDQKEEFHPQNQCLLLESSTSPGKFIHLPYVFGKDKNPEIPAPINIQKPNMTFVDIDGNPKIQDITRRELMLLDNTLFKTIPREEGVYTVHVFVYADLLNSYTGVRPINRLDWEGIFRVYFPEITEENDIDFSYAAIRVQRFEERKRCIETLDQQLINDVPLRKPGETSRGGESISIRNMRFTWDKPKFMSDYQKFRLESVFYDMPVSQTIPYIRYFPLGNTPMSKIHVEGPLNIPTMENPSILSQWAQERPMRPEEECLMAKVLLRQGLGSTHPLYASLHIFQDGSALFTLQPNTDSKALNEKQDLYNLVPILNSAMASIPGLQPKFGKSLPAIPIYTPKTVQLNNAYVILHAWLDREDAMEITSKSLRQLLPFFRAFFQVTNSPIKEQNPLAFLRYKGVSNFQTPSRDFQYLIRVSDLQKLKGYTSLPDLVRLYKEEFEVSDDVANARVSAFLNDSAKYSLEDPVTIEYTQSENPGIDIAIFGKHPFYTFHIYRVNSILTLRRIKTLLSLLISLEPSIFQVEDYHSAQVLEEEEEEAEAAADAAAEEEAVESFADEGQTAEATLQGEAKAIQATTPILSPGMDTAEEELLFDGMGELDFGAEEEQEPVIHQSALDDELQLSTAKPSITLKELADSDTPEVAAPAAPAAASLPKEDDEEDLTDVSQIKELPSRIYFRKRLQFYDKALFSYSKTHPSLKKYPSMCAANALKQPTVMSEEEFERMKDIYAKDIEECRVMFIEYPIKKGAVAPVNPCGRSSLHPEIITTLRYGSNLLQGQSNIYICSEYWCRKDEIVILKDDFENKTVDRKGRKKETMSCPFCRGGLVKNRDTVVEGETVIERIGKDKDSGNKKHLFINFLKKTPHPEGLYLPCCFIKDHPIDQDKTPAFAPLKKLSQKLVPAEPVVPAFAADIVAAAQPVPFIQRKEKATVKILKVNYSEQLDKIGTTYIVGAEKLPLELTPEGPQIGIVPASVDSYFTQDSMKTPLKPKGLTIDSHTVRKIMIDDRTGLPNVSGFFRIAAENNKRNQPDALLAALAPYYGLNSAEDFKLAILKFVQPNVFLALNYGNFLFDFYNPATPSPPPNIIREFAQKRLQVTYFSGISSEASIRAWKGFTAFEAFLHDTEKVKEFRQFAQLLSIPNLLRWESASSNGILFIVLEVQQNGSVEVRCPPYGVSEIQKSCDVAFILHYHSGIWEPLFYTDNQINEDIHEQTMVFSRDAYASWPQIVKQRVAEYEAMCHSSGLGFYTDSPFIQAKSLLPLSTAMMLDVDIYGIMRDIYNHVSHVIYSVDEKLILVPVIDDGTIYNTTKLELDWRNFILKLASADVVKQFYETTLSEILDPSIEETYTITATMRLDKSVPEKGYAYALQLQSGLYIPCMKGDSTEDDLKESVEGSELPWSIDRKIAYGSKTPDVELTVNHKEFEEIYQHLRFTFANWFSMAPGNLKGQINQILFKAGKTNLDLPLYEKRQRLLIILENEIMSWLDSSVGKPARIPSLKRIDCRVVVESEKCNNRCVWKKDDDKCLLHIPENFDIGTKQVPTARLLIKKLIEELIRFPDRRMQLLQQDVSQYVKISEPFRSGNQYIVSEDLPAWSEMLRMDWLKKDTRVPLEEYISIQPITEAAEEAPQEDAEAPQEAEDEISTSEIPELQTIFGDSFIFIENSIGDILEGFGIVEEDFDGLQQPTDGPIKDLHTAQEISKILQLSIYQLVYPPSNPIANPPISVKYMLSERETAPCIVLVKLPDGRTGSIHMSSEKTAITIKSLPKNIKEPLLKTSKTVKE